MRVTYYLINVYMSKQNILQINHGASKSIDEVMASVTKNKVCLKGVIGIPEVRTWSNTVQQYSY